MFLLNVSRFCNTETLDVVSGTHFLLHSYEKSFKAHSYKTESYRYQTN